MISDEDLDSYIQQAYVDIFKTPEHYLALLIAYDIEQNWNKKMKKLKSLKQAHTANTQKGMGDFYGTGIKQKMGKMRESRGMQEITPKKLRTPPKSLA